jgi:hypothetical protein
MERMGKEGKGKGRRKGKRKGRGREEKEERKANRRQGEQENENAIYETQGLVQSSRVQQSGITAPAQVSERERVGERVKLSRWCLPRGKV